MSLLSTGAASRSESPLETGVFRALRADTELRQLGRQEWWLWFSTTVVTVLSIAALALSFWRPFFRHSDHFYEIRPDQAQWGTAALLVLFNGWMVYRQWAFRRRRRDLNPQNGETEREGNESSDASGFDPLTNLYTRASLERLLGKEIAYARRQDTALSLATLHIDDFDHLNDQYGKGTTDVALKEFARRLRKAIRGTDFAVRMGGGDFILVLTECTLGEVKGILNGGGPLGITASGEKFNVPYSTGWVDYQAGDMPSDLVKRAKQILHLYQDAAKNTATTLTAS